MGLFYLLLDCIIPCFPLRMASQVLNTNGLTTNELNLYNKCCYLAVKREGRGSGPIITPNRYLKNGAIFCKEFVEIGLLPPKHDGQTGMKIVRQTVPHSSPFI